MPSPADPSSGADSAVEVRRSARRRRTVSAYRDGARVIVLIPARFSAAEEREWVDRMVARVTRGERRPRSGNAELARRARSLSDRYLDARAEPADVRWVAAMRTQWASCTPTERTIRLSRTLQDLPVWVQDYVLLHELAHLIEPSHGVRFWRLLDGYPRTERARGYLDGVSAAARLPIADDLAADMGEDGPGDQSVEPDAVADAG
ncbi:MAG: M48 family metallopeptidase [Jatrophihabitans sp.]|uniref:M48 metallopeptidase family protein n=1 Tax=Jatrophihabitans sp. TaxID=1932789 RepID=UPI00391352B0